MAFHLVVVIRGRLNGALDAKARDVYERHEVGRPQLASVPRLEGKLERAPLTSDTEQSLTQDGAHLAHLMEANHLMRR